VGMAQLWLGYITWERWLAPAALLLLLLTLALRPSLPLTRKAVLLTIAMVICNRIYSPQFNLWFYPFLILHLLREPRRRMLTLVALYVVLDICNVLAYPFAFSRALDEMDSFSVFNAAERGGAWTILWSAAILLRCVVLIWLARLMLIPAVARSELSEQAASPHTAVLHRA
jgi:hypothetical protein